MTQILRSGRWEAGLLPEMGGSLGSLFCADMEILRAAPDGATTPLETACFPLVPYANRIAGARFGWRGEAVQLPRNFLPEESSLHGLGWEDRWSVGSMAGFKATLDHAYAGGNWPWAYAAQQRVRLGERGLALSMDVTNRSDRVMPCGLGFHPYFRRRPETRVQFSAAAMVEVGEDLIPTGKLLAADRLADWQAGAELPGRLVDHCFTGWGGTATITDDLGTITLAARGASGLHLYAPPDGSALCLEPVSHPPDALNGDPDAMTALPPGCSATLTMWISAA